ncbi:MAG: urea ABC transporter ATP-binding protein UrtD [Betaproteobacteria bacterium]
MSKQALLEINDLLVAFGGFIAIDHVSLSVLHGEIRCIIGPNGAGKTTLLDAICGKTQASQGSIFFAGIRIDNESEFKRTRLGMGRKFQTPSVYDDLTVYQNIQISVPKGQSMLSAIFNQDDQFDDEIQAVAVTTNLENLLTTQAGTLSHGQKQWLEIAMLLVQHPKLLLLDEPVAGMSLRERDQTVDLIQRISATQAIVVIEHDMDFVKKLSGNVTVLHQGAILCEGSIEQVQIDPRVREVYLGD